MNPRFRLVFPPYFVLLVWSVVSAMSFNGPVMPLYVASLGIGVGGWSALVASWALGMLLSEWVWGSLSDRADRRLLLVLSVLGTSVLSLLFTIHSFVLAFIVLEFAIGALGVAVGPITRACVSDEVPKTTMGFHASLWWSFFTVGRVIGPLVGAYIAQMWSFADSFWASTILSIGLSAFILLSFPAGRKMSKVANFSIMRDVKLILNLKSARLLFVTTIFVFASRTLITSFLPLYASEQIKMSTVNVGVLYSLFSGVCLTVPALFRRPFTLSANARHICSWNRNSHLFTPIGNGTGCGPRRNAGSSNWHLWFL